MVKDTGRRNPDFTLAHQGIGGYATAHYNLTEPDLMTQALVRGEGELGIGGTLLVSTGANMSASSSRPAMLMIE